MIISHTMGRFKPQNRPITHTKKAVTHKESGSDKRYSFRLLADQPTGSVHLFEAAIDLLSYATYLKCQGKDYRAENLLSLSGVYQPQRDISESKIPVALEQFLTEHPQIHTVTTTAQGDGVPPR